MIVLTSAPNQIQIRVENEQPDMAIAMLEAGLQQMVQIFVQQHDPKCLCVGARIAQNMKYHLDQISEETKSIISLYKPHDNQSNQKENRDF